MVIDGQQRLTTTALLAYEIVQRAYYLEGLMEGGGRTREDIARKLWDILFDSMRDPETRKIKPAEGQLEVFRKLTPMNIDADIKQGEIKSFASTPAGEKLALSSKIIEERLDEWLGVPDEVMDLEPEEQMERLYQLAIVIGKQFQATKHPVEDTEEAGRMFEAVNDRGRDLNRADRIKSYLVYRVSNSSDIDIAPEDIHRDFSEVYRILNEYLAEPSEVDDEVRKLIGAHWNIFSGQSSMEADEDIPKRYDKLKEVIEQIKYGSYHASKRRDDSEVEEWIKQYLESLKDAARAWRTIKGIDENEVYENLKRKLSEDLDEEQKQKIRHSIYVARSYGITTYYSLLISIMLQFESRDELDELLFNFETMVLRVYEVLGARRDAYRSTFENLSRALYWSTREDELEKVFGEDSNLAETIRNSMNEDKYSMEGGSEDFETVMEHIKEWSREYSIETEKGEKVDKFKDILHKENLEGREVTEWSGIRSKQFRNYLLYRYEEMLAGKGVIPSESFIESNIMDITVEHVWPESRDEDSEIAGDLSEEEYKTVTNRLGNLALLNFDDNNEADNMCYRKKWNQHYREHGATFMVQKEFPNPNPGASNDQLEAEEDYETWNKEVIEWRSERMAEKLADYWSVEAE